MEDGCKSEPLYPDSDGVKRKVLSQTPRFPNDDNSSFSIFPNYFSVSVHVFDALIP